MFLPSTFISLDHTLMAVALRHTYGKYLLPEMEEMDYLPHSICWSPHFYP